MNNIYLAPMQTILTLEDIEIFPLVSIGPCVLKLSLTSTKKRDKWFSMEGEEDIPKCEPY